MELARIRAQSFGKHETKGNLAPRANVPSRFCNEFPTIAVPTLTLFIAIHFLLLHNYVHLCHSSGRSKNFVKQD